MKKTNRIFGKPAVKVIGFLLIACFLSVPAFAMTTVDSKQPASLTVEYKSDGMLLENVVVDLFQVADIDAAGRYSVTEDFADYPVSLTQTSSAGWRALAETLAQYVRRDRIPLLERGTTDSRGRVTFQDLKVGLYLVCGHRYQDGDFTYIPEPILVSLPGRDASGNWVYQVKINGKGESHQDSPEVVKVKVLKVWHDAGSEENRPASIEAQLLRNGVVYDTVSLSAKNNWRYTWSDLDPDDVWSVVEKTVPDGYVLLISKDGITYVLTNTYEPELSQVQVEKIWNHRGYEGKRPDDIQIQLLCDGVVYDTVTLNDANGWKYVWTDLELGHAWKIKEVTALSHYKSEVRQNGAYFTVINTYVVEDTGSLPETGQLWWPIPVLLCAGMVFFVIGFLTKNKRGRDDGE